MGPSTKHKSTIGVGNKSGFGTPGANGATTRNDNSITLNDISPINHLTSVNQSAFVIQDEFSIE